MGSEFKNLIEDIKLRVRIFKSELDYGSKSTSKSTEIAIQYFSTATNRAANSEELEELKKVSEEIKAIVTLSQNEKLQAKWKNVFAYFKSVQVELPQREKAFQKKLKEEDEQSVRNLRKELEERRGGLLDVPLDVTTDDVVKNVQKIVEGVNPENLKTLDEINASEEEVAEDKQSKAKVYGNGKEDKRPYAKLSLKQISDRIKEGDIVLNEKSAVSLARFAFSKGKPAIACSFLEGVPYSEEGDALIEEYASKTASSLTIIGLCSIAYELPAKQKVDLTQLLGSEKTLRDLFSGLL
jgi:hypothetical protein